MTIRTILIRADGTTLAFQCDTFDEAYGRAHYYIERDDKALGTPRIMKIVQSDGASLMGYTRSDIRELAGK